MILLGSVGLVIGLLGLFLFRGYHHDHNIGHEIVEQKKNDFVRSVYTTLRNLDMNNENIENSLIEQTNLSTPQPIIVPELVVTESTTNINHNEQRIKRQIKQDLILPSLNDTYKNAFIVSETTDPMIKDERISDSSDQQLRVPDRISVEFTRMRSRSGDSIMSSTSALNQVDSALDDEFQKSRVYATLHALCLHSLVNIHDI
jgi:Co/Zn/Cd efflux system component